MDYHYETCGGVCSRSIDITIEDGILTSASFEGGCSGNTQGIAKLALGMKATDVAQRLKGVKCGYRDTSCPDQLALAVEKALDTQCQQTL